MNEVKKEQRNSGVDLLRMLVMLMVLIAHILGPGGILTSCAEASSQYCVAWLLETIACCSINCYALISGYVGIHSSYKYANIILLWLRVVFYNIAIALVFFIFVPGSVAPAAFIKAFFPVMRSSYWYFTAYFCLFFFIPLLNKAVHMLTERQLRAVVIALIAAFSVLQTLLGDKFGTAEGSSALWLIVIYIIGGYVKKSNLPEKISSAKAVMGVAVLTVFSWGFKILTEMAALHQGENRFLAIMASYSACFTRHISPTNLGVAVFLLILFVRMPVSFRWKKCITFWAPLAFSVYLIHAHPLVWNYLIRDRFASLSLLPAPAMAIAVVGIAVGIYAVCSAMDILRTYIFKVLKIKEKLLSAEKKFVGDLWSDS